MKHLSTEWNKTKHFEFHRSWVLCDKKRPRVRYEFIRGRKYRENMSAFHLSPSRQKTCRQQEMIILQEGWKLFAKREIRSGLLLVYLALPWGKQIQLFFFHQFLSTRTRRYKDKQAWHRCMGMSRWLASGSGNVQVGVGEGRKQVWQVVYSQHTRGSYTHFLSS